MILLLLFLLFIHTASSFSALQEWVEHRSNARPKVMFMSGKQSQYYDLASSKWVQTIEETTEGSWSSILKFCQKNYPHLDITNVKKSDTASVKVQWCNYNNPSKCRKFASRVPWYCLERSRTASPGTESPSLQPTSVTDMMCLSMEISFDVCISITEVTVHCKQRCDAQNLSFQSLNPKDSCNDSRSNMSLRAADIKCCPTTGGYNRGADLFPNHETEPPKGGNIGDIFGPVDTSESTNPFLPKAPLNITKLPDEWCGLEDVEKGTDDINAAITVKLREMYNQTKGKDVDPYNEVVKNGTRAVIKLYTGHFECLMTTLVNTTISVQSLWDQTKERFPERAEKIRDYVEGSIQQVTVKRGEVEQGFGELVLEYTHLTNKYRGLVNIAQRLKSDIDKVQVALEMIINKKQPECNDCTENEIKDTTDSPIPFIRPNPPSQTDETVIETQKTIMTSGIVIVVGAVCCCIIIPAFLFFVYIVQKTLKKKKKFPSSDTLSNEQYVAILQKNGFENPTCRLPRKYLDDHD